MIASVIGFLNTVGAPALVVEILKQLSAVYAKLGLLLIVG